MSIQILDNYFSYNQRNFIYNYCRNSRFKIGWQDSDDIEKQNYQGEYVLTSTKDCNVHLMNKFSLAEHVNG